MNSSTGFLLFWQRFNFFLAWNHPWNSWHHQPFFWRGRASFKPLHCLIQARSDPAPPAHPSGPFPAEGSVCCKSLVKRTAAHSSGRGGQLLGHSSCAQELPESEQMLRNHILPNSGEGPQQLGPCSSPAPVTPLLQPHRQQTAISRNTSPEDPRCSWVRPHLQPLPFSPFP